MKVGWQRVQSELEVQDRQFAITEPQEVQVEGWVRNSVEAQLVHEVPLLPSLHTAQNEEFAHWVQLKIAEWQDRQVDPLM